MGLVVKFVSFCTVMNQTQLLTHMIKYLTIASYFIPNDLIYPSCTTQFFSLQASMKSIMALRAIAWSGRASRTSL